VRQGKTPVLDPTEARLLLDAIDTATPIGLRDRALIGLMAFSFARIRASPGMKVEDVYVQNRQRRARRPPQRSTTCRRSSDSDGQPCLHPPTQLYDRRSGQAYSLGSAATAASRAD
jgi:hypothetical protein